MIDVNFLTNCIKSFFRFFTPYLASTIAILCLLYSSVSQPFLFTQRLFWIFKNITTSSSREINLEDPINDFCFDKLNSHVR